MASISRIHSRERSTDTRRQHDLRRLLTARRHLLQEALSTRPRDPDPIDAAQEQEEEALLVALLDYDQSVQSQVSEALARIEAGEYGRCADCGQAIPAARLQALPFALRCLSCQERFEDEAGRMARRQALWAA
jgi:RNA polymerase-binding protein DksA